ncbi:hypothetical protein, partial [Clostridium sp.]|uniref:hypothetical protein n=1 Tax=Clostridium sp. TaxID=1506 RepID=UPI003EECC81B
TPKTHCIEAYKKNISALAYPISRNLNKILLQIKMVYLISNNFTPVLRWFYGGFTVVLRWFYGGFTVVLRW